MFPFHSLSYLNIDPFDVSYKPGSKHALLGGKFSPVAQSISRAVKSSVGTRYHPIWHLYCFDLVLANPKCYGFGHGTEKFTLAQLLSKLMISSLCDEFLGSAQESRQKTAPLPKKGCSCVAVYHCRKVLFGSLEHTIQ